MLTPIAERLSTARATVTALELELRNELAELPSKMGFESPAAFLVALREATSGTRGRGRPAGKPSKQRRQRITDEIRSEVKRLVESGNTGKHVASTLGISIASVQNVKKSLGLVSPRK